MPRPDPLAQGREPAAALNLPLAVITPCYNDFPAFATTLASLREELLEQDELIVVDSSEDRHQAEGLIRQAGLRCSTRCLWCPPAGIYPAHNRGIRESASPWLLILNSGDLLLPGGRGQIAAAIAASPRALIHVFAQRMGNETGPGADFQPGPVTVWPHQSVVLARVVHERFGFYDPRHALAADQIFLATVRRECPFELHSFRLTQYDLAGRSVAVSWAGCCGIYQVFRLLGRSRISSAVRGFCLPALRGVIQKVFGLEGTNRLKFRLLSRYQKRPSR
jgi:hypothetical protein